MVPAWVAPFVRGPPSSPAEVTKAPRPLASAFPTRRSSALRPKPSLVPTITVYVPVVGAFVATCTAEAPAELVASSTPVGDTRRIQGLKPARSEERRVGKGARSRRSAAENKHKARAPREMGRT